MTVVVVLPVLLCVHSLESDDIIALKLFLPFIQDREIVLEILFQLLVLMSPKKTIKSTNK